MALGEIDEPAKPPIYYTRERQAARRAFIQGAALQAMAVLQAADHDDIDDLLAAVDKADKLLWQVTAEALKACVK